MPIEGLDAERCRTRRRIAARRDGVETAPLRFLPTEELSAKGQRGTLPQAPDAVMAAINARLPDGAEPLESDQVYVHFLEAVNTSFIPDRYAFIDRGSLQNAAVNAAQGIAFMNSHRTGGMSTDTELPFGKTFAGRYDEDEDGARTTMGAYMLRGVKPNGDSGPSTDDLDRMIRGGTIQDVSVGFYSGDQICDVCGTNLNETGPQGEYLCPHVPGTTHGMTPAEQKAQKARGVPEGRASYSICNARLSEVSAVYDGAVTGAGFRKALALGRCGRLAHAELLQARGAYAGLLASHDLPEDPNEQEPRNRVLLTGPDVIDIATLGGGPRPQAGVPFAVHSHSVLAAVEEYVQRAQDYAALKAQDGRALSSERRADFTRLRDDLTRLLEATEPKADEAAVIALRARILRRQASRREAVRE